MPTTYDLATEGSMMEARYLLANAHPDLGHALILGSHVIVQGTEAERPTAGLPGRLYFAIDVNGGTLYRDDGQQWVQLAIGLGEALIQALAETNLRPLLEALLIETRAIRLGMEILTSRKLIA